MRKFKIDFVDFWNDFDKTNNFLWNVLSENFDVEISENPDLLIYSCYSINHYKYKCHKLLYIGENIMPDFNKCDFAISFSYTKDERNYRMPVYYINYHQYQDSPHIKKYKMEKTKFCNFVFSNPNCETRNSFFELLSKYKKVDSGGKVFNNLGYFVKDKLTFIDDYKFTIAFENQSFPGYTTEKLLEPLLVKSIPIYWGSKDAVMEFNPNAFINAHDYENLEDLVAKVMEVDNDQELYSKYIESPIFIDNKVPGFLKKEELANFLKKVLNSVDETQAVSFGRFYFCYALKDKYNYYINYYTGKIEYYFKKILRIKKN